MRPPGRLRVNRRRPGPAPVPPDEQEGNSVARICYLTPHDVRHLDWACAPIRSAFGVTPYLVGSAMTRPDYRDVDVRLILTDKRLRRLTGGSHATHMLLNVAMTDMVSRAAGLARPVDFQFQSQTEADGYPSAEHPRNPLGLRA